MTVFIILLILGAAGFYAYNKFFKKKEEQVNPFISSELQEKLQKKVQRETPAAPTEEEFKKAQLENLAKVAPKKEPVVEKAPEPVVEPAPIAEPVIEVIKNIEAVAEAPIKEVKETIVEQAPVVQPTPAEVPAKKRRKYTKRKRK